MYKRDRPSSLNIPSNSKPHKKKKKRNNNNKNKQPLTSIHNNQKSNLTKLNPQDDDSDLDIPDNSHTNSKDKVIYINEDFETLMKSKSHKNLSISSISKSSLLTPNVAPNPTPNVPLLTEKNMPASTSSDYRKVLLPSFYYQLPIVSKSDQSSIFEMQDSSSSEDESETDIEYDSVPLEVKSTKTNELPSFHEDHKLIVEQYYQKINKNNPNSIFNQKKKSQKKGEKNTNEETNEEEKEKERDKIEKEIEKENSWLLSQYYFEEIFLNPMKSKEFFKYYWQKRPVVIRRNEAPPTLSTSSSTNDGNTDESWTSNFYEGDSLFSWNYFLQLIKNQSILYTENVDVVNYTYEEEEEEEEEGGIINKEDDEENEDFGEENKHATNNKKKKKVKLNVEGRVYPSVIKNFFKEGNSIRFLNPQSYCLRLKKIISHIQEFFASGVGANVYFTPNNNSQGFAPHYDDIDAFVLQIDGQKRWHLWNKTITDELGPSLPITSSNDFDESQLGPPDFDVVLNPGDLLYFPRGCIHQAHTTGNYHSTHITISAFQRTSWYQFFEKAIPRALSLAMEDSTQIRETLPINYLSYMGVSHSPLDDDDVVDDDDNDDDGDEMSESEDEDEEKRPKTKKERERERKREREKKKKKARTGKEVTEIEKEKEKKKKEKEKEKEKMWVGLRQTDKNKCRKLFKKRVGTIFMKSIKEHLMSIIDSTCDQLAIDYMHQCISPILSEREKRDTIRGREQCIDIPNQNLNSNQSSNMGFAYDLNDSFDFGLKSNKSIQSILLSNSSHSHSQMNSNSNSNSKPIHFTINNLKKLWIRIIRSNCMRMVVEEDSAVVYYNTENTFSSPMVRTAKRIEFILDYSQSIEYIFQSYPNWINSNEIDIDQEIELLNEDKVLILQTLYHRGIIAVRDQKPE